MITIGATLAKPQLVIKFRVSCNEDTPPFGSYKEQEYNRLILTESDKTFLTTVSGGSLTWFKESGTYVLYCKHIYYTVTEAIDFNDIETPVKNTLDFVRRIIGRECEVTLISAEHCGEMTGINLHQVWEHVRIHGGDCSFQVELECEEREEKKSAYYLSRLFCDTAYDFENVKEVYTEDYRFTRTNRVHPAILTELSPLNLAGTPYERVYIEVSDVSLPVKFKGKMLTPEKRNLLCKNGECVVKMETLFSERLHSLSERNLPILECCIAFPEGANTFPEGANTFPEGVVYSN